MTDSFKEIAAFVRQSLSEFYTKHGFAPKPNSTILVRKSDGFLQEVFFGVTAEFQSSINFRPHFCVFNDQLEKNKKLFLGDIQVIGGSVLFEYEGRDLARKLGVSDYRDSGDYKIWDEVAAIKMIDHHQEFMSKVGWRFFEITSTLEGIHEFLNTKLLNIETENLTDAEKMDLLNDLGLNGMINGIIVASLVKEKNFDKLVSNYRAIYFPPYPRKILNILLDGMVRI